VSRVILFNKPYGVLTQFTSESGHQTLKEFIPVADVYAAGRLDADSEGLVVLTDNGALQAKISDPRHKQAKIYWVQVEGIPDEAALSQLREGLTLSHFTTLPCGARRIDEPAGLWSRSPPIRHRESIPSSWLEITLREGKNRQVRRMTAHVGYPTLRLIRWAVGDWTLKGLAPGGWRYVENIQSPCQLARKKRVIGRDGRFLAGRVAPKSTGSK